MREPLIFRNTACVCLLVCVSLTSTAATGATGSAPEPTAEAVLGVAPFEQSSEMNRIIVNLAPEGNRPLTMMLDTGASGSVMTPLVARALGVTVRRTKSSPYRRSTFLGRDLQFYVDTSSSDSGSRTGWEYGLLGGEFLAKYVVELDFKGRRVRFLDPKKYRVPESVDAENEVIVPLQIVGNRPMIKIEMNGTPVSVLMDTGAPWSLILSGKAATKLGVDVGALPPFGVFGTTVGPMAIHLHETESFVFGGFPFERMPVFVSPRGWYNVGGSSDSAVGYDTLSQFTIRIDYPRQRMWLRRETSEVTYLGAPYKLSGEAGLFLQPLPGAFVVVGVVPGSAADEFGLKTGDALTQIMGQKRLTLEQVIEKVTNREPILVVRRQADDVFVDITLPEGTSLATLPFGASREDDEQERERLRIEAAERDRTAADRFEKKKNETLYVKSDSGAWMSVRSRDRRRGPKEGEAWVTFEEMQRIKQEAAGGGGQ